MTKTSVVFNHIRLHTSVRIEQLNLLGQLAKNPAISSTKTIAELVSLMLASFLSQKPFLRSDWEWIRPKGCYTSINHVRHKSSA